VDPAQVLGAFLEELARDYRPGSPDFTEVVIGRYRAVCSTIGRRVRATTTEGRVVEGDAVGVDDLGGLMVRADEGLETVRFGDVEHLRPDALPG
jgi:BirA family biotin operon repressor/biotin-[acetyl-CoA-carboxylase] ligase